MRIDHDRNLDYVLENVSGGISSGSNFDLFFFCRTCWSSQKKKEAGNQLLRF
jgi:hypothetical protein